MERTLDNGNTGDIADHLVIPTVSRKIISTQDLTDCDNNRTPVIFPVPDNLGFVGVMPHFKNMKNI